MKASRLIELPYAFVLVPISVIAAGVLLPAMSPPARETKHE
jgi:hypothetical protein